MKAVNKIIKLEYNFLCVTQDYNGTQHSRCDKPEVLLRHNCSSEFVANPEQELTSLRNDTLTDGDTSTPATQLAPQQIKLRLRPSKVASSLPT